jgi:Na+/H+-dicarboxylate symporter
VVKAGNLTNKAADLVDKAFGHYMNFIGLPAIFAVTSSSIATLGLGELSSYGGLYASITLGFAGAAGFLAAASYAYGARKKEFKEIFKTASTAFGISSSAATMPVTKESLRKIGVSAKTRNSVVPLGANFNMMGTSLYLGSVAASASVMFGQDPSLIDRATIMGLCILTAFGAPGAPASTIIFLEPVLNKMGLSSTMASKVYEIIMPIDRPADMIQTSVNVTGDMVVAMGKDLRFKKARIERIKKIREDKALEKASPSSSLSL